MRKIWWATAPLAAGLMLAASSQPYFSLYRPWALTKEHVVAAEGGHFSLPVGEWGLQDTQATTDLAHEAEIKILGFQEIVHNEQIGIYPPDGFTTWLVLMEWNAPSDSLLSRCGMWFTGSDGKDYPRSDFVFSSDVDENLQARESCTPPRAGGPKQDWDTGEVTTEEPRPEQWRKLAPIAMPNGVRPTELHFLWLKPHYVTIVLPEPAEFIDESSDGAAGE
ncbi:hypothetical protein [Corynebacterium glaucum]|nr:hypothetical protein [Corynebacterium glaucum]